VDGGPSLATEPLEVTVHPTRPTPLDLILLVLPWVGSALLLIMIVRWPARVMVRRRATGSLAQPRAESVIAEPACHGVGAGPTPAPPVPARLLDMTAARRRRIDSRQEVAARPATRHGHNPRRNHSHAVSHSVDQRPVPPVVDLASDLGGWGRGGGI
jgi:hypothetical protein